MTPWVFYAYILNLVYALFSEYVLYQIETCLTWLYTSRLYFSLQLVVSVQHW